MRKNVKQSITKKLAIVGLMALLTLGISGCSKENEPSDKSATKPTETTKKEPQKETAKTSFPFTLTTKDDATVTFDRVPERVLSTNPNTGEQLMALGLGAKIIATSYNNAELLPEQYRQEYESKPVIADKYPSLEATLDLNPDFIYGRSSAFSDKDTAIATHDKLSEYGIMSLSSIEGYKLGCDVEDVYQDFYNLGKIFQVEDKATEVVDYMKKQIEAVKGKIKNTEAVKVFNFDAEQDGGAYTPGNNFTSKLIRHAGGINIFENLEKTWNMVSWEAVLEGNPDIIMINDYGDVSAQDKIALLNSTPALAGVKAIQDQKFIVITLPEVFASARVGDTVEKLAKEFHPDAFK